MECTIDWGGPDGMMFVARTGSGHVAVMDGAPEGGGHNLAPRPMEMLLLGDAIDAPRAERWGLVNRIVEPADLLPTAMDYATRLAANAPLAVQAAKELALRSRDADLATGLRMEQLFLRILQNLSLIHI